MRTLVTTQNNFPFSQTGAPPTPVTSSDAAGGFYDNANGNNHFTVGDGDQLNSWMVDFRAMLLAAGQDPSNSSFFTALQTLLNNHGSIAYATGNYSFTVPANVYNVFVRMWGGGGGGGGAAPGMCAGGGGGAGGYVEGWHAVTPGQVLSVVVGAPGGAGVPGVNGTQGTNTSFASFLATGGLGGVGAAAGSVALGGTGGTGSGGTLNAGGGNGTAGLTVNITVSGNTGTLYEGGFGGPALFGPVNPGNFGQGQSAFGPGSGGPGGANGGGGGTPGGGFMIIAW